MSNSYNPYDEWDLEFLEKEKLAIQESIKHGCKTLAPTLRQINAAIKRKQKGK